MLGSPVTVRRGRERKWEEREGAQLCQELYLKHRQMDKEQGWLQKRQKKFLLAVVVKVNFHPYIFLLDYKVTNTVSQHGTTNQSTNVCLVPRKDR